LISRHPHPPLPARRGHLWHTQLPSLPSGGKTSAAAAAPTTTTMIAGVSPLRREAIPKTRKEEGIRIRRLRDLEKGLGSH